MSTEDEFASAAAAAANQADAGSGEGGVPSEEGHEPAGEDPIALLSKSLAGAGVTPEKAREALQSIAYLQTPQGHQEYIESFVRSEQGKALRDRFGQEVLAEHLARPGGPQAVVKMLQDWGVPFPTAPQAGQQEQEEDLSPSDREVRAMREQQRALEAKIQRMEQGSTRELQEVRGKLQGMEENSRRLEEFTAWSKTVTPMGAQAYAAVAKRAQQLAALNPNAYGGPGGFRRAAGDAATELQSAASLFSPKQRARSLRNEGGGVAPATQDVLKKIAPKGELDINALRASYDLVAEDFARTARDRSE